MGNAFALEKLSVARQAIAEVKTIPDAKQLLDKFTALQDYAKRQRLELDIQNEIAECRIWTRRKIGTMLEAMPKAKGTRGQLQGSNPSGGSSVEPPEDSTPTLADVGISKAESSRMQTEASVPDVTVQEYVEEMKEAELEITTTGLRRKAKREENKRRQADPPIPLPLGKYRVIYADPPWSYSNSGFSQSAASQYPTMAIEDICALPVGDLAADECVLFLWATSPLLPEALRVMAAWGFEYKASRVWVKNRAPGLGWFVNTRHEFLLIGVRGRGHPKIKIDSVIEADVTGHSAKPHIVYEQIEQCYDGPYIELFARNTREGWHSWGNEV